jgi:regulatory protein
MTADRGKRPPPKITPSYVENAAMHYLERFSSSTANLKRVLMRKADRSLAHWGGERSDALAVIDAVIMKLAGLGYLDDAAYAAAKARGLHRRGTSGRVIRAALAAKGVASEQADAALGGLADEAEEPDHAACLNLARRRRLGPFRLAEKQAEFRDKDMAALARAGFSWDVVKRVMAGEE